MQTREQRYAIDVSRRVEAIKAGALNKERYGVLAFKLPVLIRTAGLVQALAFVHARGNREGRQLLDDLAGTLDFSSGDALVGKSRSAFLMEYIHMTQRALDALLWYKRFAQSVLDVEPTDQEE